MALDAFLKIDGIPGESTDDKHKEWIEILAYSWGAAQPVSRSASTSGGAASARADFHDFHVTKTLDKSTPKLALACADGTHIKEVIIELCRAGGDKLKYMEYKMNDVIISSISSGGTRGDDVPTEELAFNYGKISWTYTQQKRADGSGGGNVPAGWDLEANKKL